jgi:hypothetical protein
MPDLDFRVLGVEAAQRGVTPLLQFNIEILNKTPAEKVQSVMLHAQIQIQSPQRAYSASEKEKLRDLFGRPENWGQTLRNKLLAHANCVVPGFTERTETVLAVPCTFDLNVAATKYFYALEAGEVPLLFLFSGTVFYSDPTGRLQIQQISWETESAWRMSIGAWREMMDHHYPNTAFMWLERGVFDRLYEFKRQHGFATWEQAMEQLLSLANNKSSHSERSEATSRNAAASPFGTSAGSLDFAQDEEIH